MTELTFIIDYWGKHNKLKEYLMSLNGILDIIIVIIKNEELSEIHINYDSNLITPQIIKSEILSFFDLPVILAFDKHPMAETSNYKMIRDDLCCEFCFKGVIIKLFEIEGIEQVESDLEYLLEKDYECDNVVINIKYNPNIINTEEIKKIESNI